MNTQDVIDDLQSQLDKLKASLKPDAPASDLYATLDDMLIVSHLGTLDSFESTAHAIRALVEFDLSVEKYFGNSRIKELERENAKLKAQLSKPEAPASPRGQPIPDTVEAWRKHAHLMADQVERDREVISKLKQKVNKLAQAYTAGQQSDGLEAVLDKVDFIELTKTITGFNIASRSLDPKLEFIIWEKDVDAAIHALLEKLND